MPTRQHPGTLRSRRVQGIAHNLLALPASAPTTTPSKGVPAKKTSTKQIAASKDGDDETFVPSTDNDDGTSDEEQIKDAVVSSKAHPSKNYTKPVLYDKLIKAT